MSAAPKSDARVEFRLPSRLKAEIERAAMVSNRSITDFATSVLTDAARKILAEHENESHIALSDRDRERFLEMLDGDNGPNQALKAAARRHRKRVA